MLARTEVGGKKDETAQFQCQRQSKGAAERDSRFTYAEQGGKTLRCGIGSADWRSQT